MPNEQYHHLAKEPLADALLSLEKEGSSAVVEVETPHGRAEVSIKNGRLLGAAFGDSSGAEALRQVLDLSVGRYQLHVIPKSESPQPESPQPVGESLSELIGKQRSASGEKPAVRLGTRQVLSTSSSVPPANEPAKAGKPRVHDEVKPSPLRPVQGVAVAPARRVTLGGSAHKPHQRSAPQPETDKPAYREPTGWNRTLIGSSRAPEPVPEADSVQSVKYVAHPVRNLGVEEPPHPGSTLGGGFEAVPVTGRAGSAASESSPPLLEPAPVASAPIDTKASMLTTSIQGTAPTFEPSRPPVPGFVQSDWDEEPVPSRRFKSETLEELHELNEKIQSSRPAGGFVAGAAGRSFAPGSTMKSSSEKEEGALPRVGRYEVLARLKSGGMGSVYLCRLSGSAGFRRLFAMKVLSSELTGSEELESFFYEAELLSKLHHPNIVGIVDVGTIEQPYIVLDYVEGGSLFELCQATPRARDPKKVISIVLDALTGIDAAHRATDEHGNQLGLVHCDLTPHNLLVGVNGACRVADFGIATQRNRTEAALRGKPGYVAPERIRGQSGDARSDLFSLGVALYSALTGVEPFAAETPEQTLNNVLTKSVPSPSEVGLCPPPALDWVCMKALARDPDERFQTAEEMMMHLRNVAARQDLLASQAQVAEWVTSALGPMLEARRKAAHRGDENARPALDPAPGDAPIPAEAMGNPAPAPPPSYASNEKTEYLPPLEDEKRTPSLVPRSLANLPKQKRRGVYMALIGAVAALVLTLFLPSLTRSWLKMDEEVAAPPPAPRVEVKSAQGKDEEEKKLTEGETGTQPASEKKGPSNVEEGASDDLPPRIVIPDIK